MSNHPCACRAGQGKSPVNHIDASTALSAPSETATDRGKEAQSISCEPMNKNWIEGDAEQGERANNRRELS